MNVSQRDEVDLTLIRGVNDDDLKRDHHIVSVGSCTANAVTPVLRVIDENFGIEKAFLCTAHSYTNEQRVADVPHKEIRRSRAAAENIIPTQSNAAKTIAKAYAEAGVPENFAAFIEPKTGHVLSEKMWSKTQKFFAKHLRN